MVRRVYVRRMQGKPRVLRSGNLAHRPSKLKVSPTLPRLPLPALPFLRSLLYSSVPHRTPVSHIKGLGLNVHPPTNAYM